MTAIGILALTVFAVVYAGTARWLMRHYHGLDWWNTNTDGRWRFMQRRAIGATDGDPYIIRYTLLGTPWLDVKVHHLIRPDQDPVLHTHPWWMLAVILAGGYVEQRPGILADNPALNGPRRHLCRRPGHLYFMRLRAAHRIDQLTPRPARVYHVPDGRRLDGTWRTRFKCERPVGGCWSLVVTGPKHTDPGWGFVLDDGTWVDEDTYLAVAT